MQPQVQTKAVLNDLGMRLDGPPYWSFERASGPRRPVGDSAAGPAEERLAVDFGAFVSGSVAALPKLPMTSASRLCLQLFLLGAANRLWTRAGQGGRGFAPLIAALLDRHGLPGSETIALGEAYPELAQDLRARRMMDAGSASMDEFVAALRGD